MGPSVDLTLRRKHQGSKQMRKQALRVPKEAKDKDSTRKKNVEGGSLGSKLGRVHMHKQDYAKLSLRKMKGNTDFFFAI